MDAAIPPAESIAQLPVLDAAKLLQGDEVEIQNLLRACKTHGFFSLNLGADETSYMIGAWTDVLAFMDRYFDQPTEVKLRDERHSDTHGYEPCGTSTGATDEHLDHYESLKISFTECMSRSENLAPALKENIELFETFIGGAHRLVMALLKCLTRTLGDQIPGPLESFHDPSQPTTSTMAMFRYPRQTEEEAAKGVGHNKHTDIGTFTFLLCQQWGLQVLSPVEKKWLYVAPKKDHAIINVGDSLRFLTGNQLFSAVHRVLPFTHRQLEHRHSIAFFLRPADNTIYRDSKDRLVTARSWHDEKFDHFRASHAEQSADSILTGGMEQLDQIIVPTSA
ncbi:putative 2OG-Fe(II) oxygenase family oxidoreductase [Aspergillus clavatus NRRL 1]|uniref:2OG-Fe(II) oxygenase family oxidoreductase, putative n=1 Tax=Aspergillus clavatus (strain ATCC 1007 / CBS 513.65 / DSM 816 / NCTC 3887 / NRRL 1 / QM 1276 / 107) TaxID=344612 RepID=A1CMV7_ASPCL|nr:2OG-Fe(II) oxygenase family oxidoreductase, putative [Aspergillus clavatus NRRL 1]EAW08894.1 2OG-Fe(II) oxygenase family oxidoreductase, putative [Aspergillus clavatus NRRL 1]